MGSHFNSDIGVENVKIEYVRYFCVILMQDNINFPIFLWYNVFFPNIELTYKKPSLKFGWPKPT